MMELSRPVTGMGLHAVCGRNTHASTSTTTRLQKQRSHTFGTFRLVSRPAGLLQRPDHKVHAAIVRCGGPRLQYARVKWPQPQWTMRVRPQRHVNQIRYLPKYYFSRSGIYSLTSPSRLATTYWTWQRERAKTPFYWPKT